MVSLKTIYSFLIGGAVFIFYLCYASLLISSAPEEIKTPANIIEATANEQGIIISEKAYFLDKCNDIGFLGTKPNCDITGALSARDFTSTVVNEKIENIYYIFEEKNSQLIKRYRASSAKEEFEWFEIYELQIGEVRYMVAGHDAGIATLRKNNNFSWYRAIVLSFIFGASVCSILYGVLAGLEYLSKRRDN